MVIDQAALMQIITTIQQAQQKQTHPTPATPRVGGVNTMGAWTGGGARSDPNNPRTNLCLRALQMDPSKAFAQLTTIEKECRSGLKSKPGPLFCLGTEPDAKHIITVINNLEDFLTTHGMESVFTIDEGTRTFDMLKRPAMLTKDVVDKWIKNLTVDGVPVTGKSNLPVCPYDLTNLEWSYDTILNSCSDALVLDLKRNLKDDQATGPALLFAVLQICYRQAESKVESVLKLIEKLNLRDFPGQNVTSYKQKLDEYLTELEMNIPQDAQIPGLRNKALKGLTNCTFDFFRNRVLDKLIAAEPATVNDIKDIVKELDILYLTLMEQDNYPPGVKAIPEDSKVLALQAEMKFLKTEMTKLHQDRSASSTKGSGPSILKPSEKTIRFLDQEGASASSNKPSQRTPKPNGLSDEDNAKVTALIKEKLPTMPKFDDIPLDKNYTIDLDGKTVATFCNKCHRFTRGTNRQTTQEHKGPSMRPKGKSYMSALNAGPPANPPEETPSLDMAPLAPIQAPTSSYAFYCASDPPPSAETIDLEETIDPVLLAALNSFYPKG